MQAPPFRKAVTTDPYFKRLSGSVKQHFWKIFKNIPYSQEFRELMEKMLAKFPSERNSIDLIRVSSFLQQDTMSSEQFLADIRERYKKVEEHR